MGLLPVKTRSVNRMDVRSRESLEGDPSIDARSAGNGRIRLFLEARGR